MGVIQRQTIKNNLLAYIAVAIAAYASVYVYPENNALKGHADGILKWALLIYPAVTVGMSAVIVRFFPYLEGEKRGAQLFTRGLVVVTGVLFGLAILNVTLGDFLIEKLIAGGYLVGKLADYRWHILGLTAALAYLSVVKAHLVNSRRIAIPVIFENLWPKIGLLIIFLGALGGFYGREGFTNALLLIYVLSAVGILIYAVAAGGKAFSWGKLAFKEKNIGDLYSLAAFGVFGSIGSVLLTHMDTIFVNTYIDDDSTNIYSFAIFVTMVIAIPFRAVNSIASPIVSERYKAKDFVHLGDLYRQTSQVLFAAGGLIYAGALVCLPYVYQLTDSSDILAAGYTAAVLLGAAQLIDQLTSINGTLVTYSDFYRWNIVFLILVGALNGILNYLFIVSLGYGLMGGALATLASMAVYNLIKVLFIYWKMGIHPLSWSPVVTALVLGAAGFVATFLPVPGGAEINVIVRGGVLAGLYFLYLRFTNGVPPLRRALRDGVKAMLR